MHQGECEKWALGGFHDHSDKQTGQQGRFATSQPLICVIPDDANYLRNSRRRPKIQGPVRETRGLDSQDYRVREYDPLLWIARHGWLDVMGPSISTSLSHGQI